MTPNASPDGRQDGVAPAPPMTSPEAARKKELHRRSMVWTGAFMTACGLAAAYLAFTTGPIPNLFFGQLRPAAPPAQGKSRKAKTALVGWRPWGDEAFAEARKNGKLVLLNVCVSYNRACAVMDETTYADPRVAEAADKFVTVRVDADERPDVAARYQSGGWPSTLILSADGRPLGRATFLTPELFLPWAKAIDEAYRKRKGEPLPELKEEPDQLRPDAVGQAPELTRAWDNEGPRFPRFDWIEELRSLTAQSMSTMSGHSCRTMSDVFDHASQAVLAIEDRAWGGFFRCADGPGWSNPETEKTLVDQAQAILAGVEVKKTLAYVDRFLTDEKGGYYASQSCEVRKGDDVIEGRYYYSLSDAERSKLGIPAVDKRKFAYGNLLMVRAAISAGDAAQKRRASRTLDLLWRGARKGLVPHGLLIDELALGRALLAAGRRGDAKLVADAIDHALLDKATGAYFDRPAQGALFPSQNFEAFLFLRDLRPDRAQSLKSWLLSQSARLDPVARAALSPHP